ncbi:MAG: AbrB/MazE/SpoVT family DNA-binding domain-containing protein [Clostridia bacterium]|nr:AbrB/MazE/SpoVT family DNA-binding domain-containing protein [Clostridia bacterium]
MKATGIVRRIDDLGRVVIPKEIRRTMRIREGDPLEIYTDREGEVIFKKYSPIGELNAFAAQYAETLHKTGDLNVIICDRDAVIACAGVPKKEFSERHLSAELEEIVAGRNLYCWHEGEQRVFAVAGSDESAQGSSYFVSCAMPIISEGDILGCVVSLTPVEGGSAAGYSDRFDHGQSVEAKLIQTAAAFLGKQLEA